MIHDDLRVRKTAVTLADGRALMYFGAVPERPADYPDLRQLAAVHVQSQARLDQLFGEWVIIASHRQDRTFQPAADQCPLCPSSAGSLTEIPAPDYEVVVFENRFPTLRAQGTDTGDGDHGNGAGRQPAVAAASGSPPGGGGGWGVRAEEFWFDVADSTAVRQPVPYISAWHQAPVRRGRDDFALHLELFTIRRAPGKLKYQAGSESGMGAFANDVAPEAAAKRLRELG